MATAKKTAKRRTRTVTEVKSPVGIGADVETENDTGEKKTPEQVKDEKIAAFLETARKRFQTSSGAESDLRQNFTDDQEFEAGDQWDEEIRREREAASRPVLTIPQLGAFRRQINNSQRAARPSAKVIPQSEDATEEVAKILQGLIRRIEQVSKASVTYDTSAQHQVTIGRGWFRIVAEYDQREKFQQVIKYKRVPNPLTVYPDPSVQDLTYADMRFCLIRERMPKDDYLDLYGQEAYDRASDFFAAEDDELRANWMPEGDVVVADYYYLKYTKVKIAQVQQKSAPGEPPQRVVMIDSVVEGKTLEERVKAQGGKILMRRTVRAVEVRLAKIDGSQILEGDDNGVEGRKLPGSRIPVFPVLGEERNIDGKVDYRGIVREAKDACRMYNLAVTNEAEAIARAPKVLYIAAEGQLEGHEDEWENLHIVNRNVVFYKVKESGGQLVPPPQVVQYEPNIQAISHSIGQHAADIKRIIGMFEPTLGAQGPEQSGKAIKLRITQGEVGTSHYNDNLNLAVEAGAGTVLEWIPEIYDMPRVVQILGLDDELKQVLVHAGNLDQYPKEEGGEAEPPTPEELKQLHAVKEVYNVGIGTYGISVAAGPSFESRRQEALESMLLFIQAYPAAAPLIGHLLAKNSDWPGADEFEAILKANLPPHLRGEAGALPPEVQEQQAKLMEAMQQLKAELDAANQKLATKEAEIAAKVQMNREDNMVEVYKAQLQAGVDAAMGRMQEEFAALTAAMQTTMDREAAEAAGATEEVTA